MAVLEYRSNRHRELAFAFGAITEASPDFLKRIVRDGGELALRVASALWADNAIFPAYALQMRPRNVIRGKSINQLNKGDIFERTLGFHARIMKKTLLFVKCIIPELDTNDLHGRRSPRNFYGLWSHP